MAVEETWEEELYCKQCKKETKHTCHSSGHERDSSGEYKVCQVCDKLTSDNMYGSKIE